MASHPYTVGIDLGTTNTVVAYVDNRAENSELQTLPILQITSPGVLERRLSLPSFLYAPLEAERNGEKEKDFSLPWAEKPEWICGAYARDRGSEVPGRYISSAKSWLCQKGLDKKAPTLPFASEDDIGKRSPFQASLAILEHLKACWLIEKKCDLAEQEIILTIPASFDEEARRHTEEAARAAGLTDITLLEEPLAALYAWVQEQGDDWRQHVSPGDTILVCDIGGGTSDFSLVSVFDDSGKLGLKRSAVGEHILLGGDNMDLALAYQARKKIEENGKKLSSWQLRSLWFKCRILKEKLLSGQSNTERVTLLGGGSRLIAGTLAAEFGQAEVRNFILDGFLPACQIDDLPQEREKGAVQEIGLPFASDAAITKHLARFLQLQQGSADFHWPNRILFNGGVFACNDIRERMLSVINQWLSKEGLEQASGLHHVSLDHAVALGAAYFGWGRNGKGIRIRAGLSRSYYLEIESSMPAVPGMPAITKAFCIAAFGMEEGSAVTLDQQPFALSIGTRARFNFLSSTARQEDPVGTTLEDWGEEMETASAMETQLDNEEGLQSPVPVHLSARVSEVGTLELSFQHTKSERSWKLEYSVRQNPS